VTCPECGEKDAARFPVGPPEVVPLFFLSACSIILSFVQAQGGGVAGVLGAFPCIVFAVAMGCAGAWRLRDPRRTPRERWAGRAWVFATLAWAAFFGVGGGEIKMAERRRGSGMRLISNLRFQM
jgi:hypothetical protein